ncbi:MAG: hypothetical protein FWJ83_08585, partial [Limnochordales bacterium]
RRAGVRDAAERWCPVFAVLSGTRTEQQGRHGQPQDDENWTTSEHTHHLKAGGCLDAPRHVQFSWYHTERPGKAAGLEKARG